MTHPALDLWHLRVFTAIVDSSGFGRAAHSLGVAQSTVSEALASLERNLGVAVLVRSGRHIGLTPAGEVLLPHARLLLRNAETAVAEVARVTERVRTTVSVGAPESVGAHLLPSAMAAVRRRWPGVRFRVDAALCADIRAAVAGGRLEVGLVLEPASSPNADATVLSTIPLTIFARSDHALARREVSAGDLWECTFVFSEAAGHYHTILRSFFERAGYPLPEFEVVGSVEAVRRSVLSGEALGALPSFVVEPDIEAGRAAAVIPMPPLGSLELKALRAPTDDPSPIAEALIEELRSPQDALAIGG